MAQSPLAIEERAHQLARRLVAVGEEVFATLGITAPLSKLDAATGEVLHTYKGTGGTEEVLVRDGRVYVLVNKGHLNLLTTPRNSM